MENTKTNEPASSKVTKLKVWMMEKGISQKAISESTSLSTNTINRLVNDGKASKSVIKLVAFELGISYDELNKLLKFRKQNGI